MFNFFANLACCIYLGSWPGYNNLFLVNNFVNYLKVVPIFGLFNNSTEAFYNTTASNIVDYGVTCPPLCITIAVILSTICCITVFFMIVKALKKLFTCFLGE